MCSRCVTLEAERDEARVLSLAKFDDITIEVLALRETLRQARQRADRLQSALAGIATRAADGAVTLEQIERAALAALEGK